MKLNQLEEQISDCYSEDFSVEHLETFDKIIVAIVSNYTERFKGRFDYYLNYFSKREISNELITDAVHGHYISQEGINKRWFHQEVFVKFQGTKPLDLLTNRLVTLKDKIEACNEKDFDTLYNLIELVSEPIENIGKLTCYDIALRLGMALDLQPEFVYLHSGAEKGYRLLVDENVCDLKIPKKKFERISSHFGCLDSKYIEDILCIYKKSFARMKKS